MDKIRIFIGNCKSLFRSSVLNGMNNFWIITVVLLPCNHFHWVKLMLLFNIFFVYFFLVVSLSFTQRHNIKENPSNFIEVANNFFPKKSFTLVVLPSMCAYFFLWVPHSRIVKYSFWFKVDGIDGTENQR